MKAIPAVALAAVVVAVYRGLISGALPFDLGIGRRLRPLGPQTVAIAASREVVFDVIAAPYLGRQTRAIAGKIQVLEKGSDMVLAAHRTPLRGGLVATTVETVRFTRPERVDFRLVRGPVPHVVEEFVLTEDDGTTRLTYRGELGTDLWALGAWWGNQVGRVWDHTVAASLETIKTESERRHRSSSGSADSRISP
jgi:hypothetical protein